MATNQTITVSVETTEPVSCGENLYASRVVVKAHLKPGKTIILSDEMRRFSVISEDVTPHD